MKSRIQYFITFISYEISKLNLRTSWQGDICMEIYGNPYFLVYIWYLRGLINNSPTFVPVPKFWIHWQIFTEGRKKKIKQINKQIFLINKMGYRIELECEMQMTLSPLHCNWLQPSVYTLREFIQIKFEVQKKMTRIYW